MRLVRGAGGVQYCWPRVAGLRRPHVLGAAHPGFGTAMSFVEMKNKTRPISFPTLKTLRTENSYPQRVPVVCPSLRKSKVNIVYFLWPARRTIKAWLIALIGGSSSEGVLRTPNNRH